MRKYIGSNLIIQNNINNMVLKHDNDIKKLQETFDKFIKPEENNHILFEGQIYDAYSLLLDILSKIDKKVIIYSKNIDEELVNKYNKQYSNIDVIYITLECHLKI